jgi:hypothetical protein
MEQRATMCPRPWNFDSRISDYIRPVLRSESVAFAIDPQRNADIIRRAVEVFSLFAILRSPCFRILKRLPALTFPLCEALGHASPLNKRTLH